MPRTQRGLKPLERNLKEPNMSDTLDSEKERDEALRMEALRLATAYSPGASAEEVVDIAKKYYDFLKAKGTSQNG